MNFNVEIRKKQLQSLDQCITSFKDKVDSILGYLGWSTKKVLENDDRTLCPINTGHTVQLESVVPHVERCRLTSSGYSLNETYLSEPSSDSKSSICLNNHEKIEVLNKIRSVNPRFVAGISKLQEFFIYIVSLEKETTQIYFGEPMKKAWNGYDPDPRTSNRLFSTYSTDERLALYNHAVEHTQGPSAPSEFDINLPEKKEEDKPLTPEEELQRERDAKRRRVKYKSVHTGRNKNYTEVMKEVISNQMEQYIDYLHNTTQANVPLEQNSEINHDNEEIDISASYVNYKQYNQMPCDISELTCPNDSSYNNEVQDKPRATSSIGRHSSHSGKSHEHSRHSSKSRSGKPNHRCLCENDRKRERSRERHHRDRERTNSHSNRRPDPYNESKTDIAYLRHKHERDKKYTYSENKRYRRHVHSEHEGPRRDSNLEYEKDTSYSHSKNDIDRKGSLYEEHNRDRRLLDKELEMKRTPSNHRNGDDRHRYSLGKRH